ncbi:type I secretion system permease/ATPase [Halomonas elongata]|uniref:type I secretion system permease/ATPase n=1 Tax=Halomonas elongata TaxID=2746 RepID=UPI00255AEC5D|nr:type I secretion system permease/ATPase [Halomonas elongata]MDL4861933.1 type I secretion system permease/ATPase [Halomonas elongata]
MTTRPAPTILQRALKACRPFFLSAALFSLFINLLMLVPPLYMLQVYDRVITSRSLDTLFMLTLIVVFLFIVMGGLEIVRSRLLVRLGNRLDSMVNHRLFEAMFQNGIRQPGRASAQPLNDLATLRQFLSGNGLFAFFDAPWTPIYIGVLFLFDVWFGVFALAAGILLFVLALTNEWATRGLLAGAGEEQIQAQSLANANLRNAEVLHAMGMMPGIRKRWAERHQGFLLQQSRASDRAGTLANLSKVLRLLAQSLILGLGALLVLEGDLTPGMMIAASILMGRALAPIDQVIGAWKQFVGARGAYGRLQTLLRSVPQEEERMSLPAPKGEVSFEQVVAVPPGGKIATLRGLDFRVAKGQHVGVIGPSGSGKSTLARVLLGIWPAQSGTVRLDGADIAQWAREELGPYVGYLPQDIELFDGTISENIARFGEIDAERVVEAARRAGVHEMILRQPDGYDTRLSSTEGVLSGGQRQRLGLARALYGDPVLVVLDEPNANLDDAGERALGEALNRLKAQGTTLFVISHRERVLKSVDTLLVLQEGQPRFYGPKADVIAQLNSSKRHLQAARSAGGRPRASTDGHVVSQ